MPDDTEIPTGKALARSFEELDERGQRRIVRQVQREADRAQREADRAERRAARSDG